MADALVIFKPDAAHRLAVREGIWAWLSTERAWKLVGLTWYQPSTELAQTHYDFLRERPFFPWLIDFMTALPVVVGRLAADPSALEEMRYELGETRIQESRPGSLRERYGILGGINCLHLSDSAETGASEVANWSKHLQLDAVDAGLEPGSSAPDHSYRLRSLASQFAAGVHRDLAGQEIRKLLKQECELEEDQFEALCRIILGAFS